MITIEYKEHLRYTFYDLTLAYKIGEDLVKAFMHVVILVLLAKLFKVIH